MISIPFRGSKKYSYKQVRKIVEENDYNKSLEPFGGTGVLSVNLFNDGLVNEAIINDYDHMFDLYPEFLDVKDEIVSECLEKGLTKTYHTDGNRYYHYENGERVYTPTELLSSEHKEILQSVISKYDSKYYQLLGTGACFNHSGRQNNPNGIKLEDFCYFRRGISTKPARKYIDVVNQCTLTHLDYKEFLETQTVDENSLLIVDPPYIDANIGTYKNETIFDYDKTLKLIGLIKDLNVDFIFFNYGIDQIQDLLKKHNLKPTIIDYTGNPAKTASRKSQDVLAFIKNSGTQ